MHHSSIASRPRAVRLLIAALAAAATLLASCVDLTEITRFASASQKVGDTFPSIAAEAPRSCLRANAFVTPDNPVARLDCDWYARMNPSLTTVNTALFAYIATLGKLSTVDTSKMGGATDDLSADLKKGDPGISATTLNKATAAGRLVKALTEIWAGGYREGKLAGIIQENDFAVKDITDFLRDYATDAYRQTLEHERGYEAIFCLNERSPAKEPLATYLLTKSCDADAAAIAQKIAAVKTYQDALTTIRNAHDRLARSTGHWDVKELSIDFGSSVGDLANAASTIQKAF